jgi:flagellar hook-length control protein FliK
MGAADAGDDAFTGAASVDFGAVLAAQLGVKPLPALLGAAPDLPSAKADAPDTAAGPEASAPDALQAALLGLPVAALPVPVQPSPGVAIPEQAQPPAGRGDVQAVQRRPSPLPDTLQDARLPATDARAPREEAAILAAAKHEDALPGKPDKTEQKVDGAPPSSPRADAPALPHAHLQEARHSERNVMEAPVRVSARSFADDVGQRVVWMATNGQHAAELRLDPPQLGPVEVRLTLNGDQATLTLLSPHQSVRDALQNSLPRLQEMLVGAGVDLGSVNVGSHAPGQDPRGEPRNNGGVAPSWMNAPSGAVSAVAIVPPSTRSLVDTYA